MSYVLGFSFGISLSGFIVLFCLWVPVAGDGQPVALIISIDMRALYSTRAKASTDRALVCW